MSLCLFCFNPKEVINVRRSDLDVFVSSVKIRSFSNNFSSYSLLISEFALVEFHLTDIDGFIFPVYQQVYLSSLLYCCFAMSKPKVVLPKFPVCARFCLYGLDKASRKTSQPEVWYS